MKTVRIAVFGLNHGFKFASDALKLPGVELIAVAGDNELSKKRAKELNVPLYKNYKDLVNECSLDGAIITLPNRLHKEAVEVCAKKGVHVLVEKPIASTIEEGEDIIRQCAQSNVKLMVGHHRRFSSKVAKLKEIISSGLLGEIVGVNMLYVLAKDRSYFAESWRLVQGGGPLLINGIHDIDTLRFVTGLNIESVYAAARNSIRKNQVEDSASILLETRGGATVNFFISDGVPSPWSYDCNLRENPKFYHYDENCFYFFGTKGSLSFPSLKMYSYEEENYGWEHKLIEEKFSVEDNDPMTAELVHFVEVLRGESEPVVTGEDGLETLKVINAIKESAAREQKIYLYK
ncbi:Gfo/Idh/MocA family protein [Aneurinibacillus terranovensis]|uniref:Gfo/Idh/MocA family protein n=1 Tax=Aneurinibacillus terranovensis TaxID=278991 RepID=UPI0004116E74|nr:Gfo/Idh/MocA family oxidoreductase [Aneurinibacillus terranovensis]